MATSLRIDVLGSFSIIRSNTQIRPLGVHARGLLTYLVAHPDRPVDRGRLADLIWPRARTASHARHSLSQALYGLKLRLGDAVWFSDAETLQIDSTRVSSDLWDLRTWMREGSIGSLPEYADICLGVDGDQIGEGFEDWLNEFTEGLRREIELWATTRIETLFLDGSYRSAEEIQNWLGKAAPPGLETVGRGADSASQLRSGTKITGFEMPFVGRRREFAALRAAFESASTGWSTQLVSGRPGIGKTRLGLRFARQCALEDRAVLHARCFESQSNRPFSAVSTLLGSIDVRPHLRRLPAIWRGALRELLPTEVGSLRETLPPLDDLGHRHRLIQSVAQLLNGISADRPTLIFIDDLQWIDRSSAEVLHHCARSLATSPVLLLATVRSTEAQSTWLAELNSTQTLELCGLTSTDVEEILTAFESKYGQVQSTTRQQIGFEDSPYRIGHLLHFARDPKGSGGRLWGVDTIVGCARELAASIAILGVPIRTSDLNRLYGTPPDAIQAATEELVAGGLISDNDGFVDFRHDLSRQAFLSSLSELERIRAHLRAASFLCSQHPDELSAIAKHLENAGDRPGAHAAALAAAGRCEAEHAMVEAADCLAIAIRTRAGDRELLELSVRLARCLEQCGRWTEAQTVLHHLQSSVRVASEADRLDLKWIRAELALLQEEARRLPCRESLRTFLEFIQDPSIEAHPALRPRLIIAAGRAAYQTFDDDAIRDLAAVLNEEWQRSDARIGDPTKTFFLRAVRNRRAALADARDRLKYATTMDEKIGATRDVAVHLAFNAELGEADRLYDKAIRMIQHSGAVWKHPLVLLNSMATLLEQGRGSDVRARAALLHSLPFQQPSLGAFDLLNLATLAHEERNPVECRRVCGQILGLEHVTVVESCHATALLGLEALERGDRSEAARRHESLRQALPERIAFLADPSYIVSFIVQHTADVGQVEAAIRYLNEHIRRAAKADLLAYWRLRLQGAVVRAELDRAGSLRAIHHIRRSAKAAGAHLVENRAERFLAKLE